MKCDYCGQSYSTSDVGAVAITLGCANGRRVDGRLEITCLKHHPSHVAFISLQSVHGHDTARHVSGALFFREETSQIDACFCSTSCGSKWWMNVFDTFLSQSSSDGQRHVEL